MIDSLREYDILPGGQYDIALRAVIYSPSENMKVSLRDD